MHELTLTPVRRRPTACQAVNMPLSRWNDDRLDDLARQVQTNTAAIKEYMQIREELVSLRERLHAIGTDAHECLEGLSNLKRDLEVRAQIQHDERRADRRWMIGTLLATASLVVAALAVFLG